MPRRLNQELPTTQTVVFNDKLLWIKIRMLAEQNNVTLSELIEIGMRHFLSIDVADLIILMDKNK